MNDVSRFIGRDSLTISETMQRIDKNSKGILFIVDGSDRLIGCITDGDIRRYLLSGGAMDDDAVLATNKKPKTAKSVDEAKNFYHSKNYIVIPIIDEERHIRGLYDGNSMDKRPRKKLNVPVVINAGGRGTRLDPFTRVLPKPLIPVGEMPIIEHIMQEYVSYGCSEFHIIINYKKDLMKAYFADSEIKYDITWYEETEPLGTGGGLSFLKGVLDETFFFANCDALLTANYESMISFHRDNHNTITMIGAYKNVNIPYGVVDIGENGVINSMREKPLMSFLANTGIYIVEPEVLEDVKDNLAIGFPDIVEEQRKKGRRTALFPVGENDWMDMGQLSELEKMRVKLYGE